MNSVQSIILAAITFLTIISFFGTCLSKKEHYRILFAFLWGICSGILILIVIVTTSSNEILLKEKKQNFPCPQYEIIEHNVYRLKK